MQILYCSFIITSLPSSLLSVVKPVLDMKLTVNGWRCRSVGGMTGVLHLRSMCQPVVKPPAGLFIQVAAVSV